MKTLVLVLTITVTLQAQQAKAIELLRPFWIAIEKRHPSKYSCCDKKGEREKKTMLVYL